MADLSLERSVFKEPPFTNTGVDCFGPFFVSVKRSTEKRWGFLFICLTTQAVHFEVVPSMDSSSCVMGIERFGARRVILSVIWADNGTNYVASEKELLFNIKNWNQQVLGEALVREGIKRQFNPSSAPHHRDVWERVVRSLKHVFYAVLGNRRLTDDNSLLGRAMSQCSSNYNSLYGPSRPRRTNPKQFPVGNRQFIVSYPLSRRKRRPKAIRSCPSVLRR